MDHEEIIGDHLMKQQEQEALEKEEIERMKKEQDIEIMVKEKALDSRECLERSITFAC